MLRGIKIKLMIVKVQQSITTNASKPQMLAYSENRKIEYLGDLTRKVKQRLNGRLKAYFDADIVNRKIELYNEVPEQDW
jgi:hypothetical protein